MKNSRARLPSLTALRAFEAASRHGSFTRAAEELSMTQAAVSYQVKQLENELGQALFRRHGRHIELSISGERLALAVTEAFDLIRSTAVGMAAETGKRISISALPTVASHWLVPRLGLFRALRPDIAFRLDTSVEIGDVIGEFDLAIRSGMGTWSGCDARMLFKSDFTVMCSPSLVSSGNLSEIADILNKPRFGRETWWEQWLAVAGTEPGASASPICDLGMQANEVAAAIRQNGVALVTPRFFSAEITSGQLMMPFPIRVEEEGGYWLVHRRGSLPAKTRFFRDWVVDQAAGDSA